MLHTIADWLLVAAFLGAGAFNAIGTQANQNRFVRWGFPRWWCYLTGALEIAIAILSVFRSTFEVGLVLGALVIVAAAVTVLRYRDFSHLPPIGLFVALLAFNAASG